MGQVAVAVGGRLPRVLGISLWGNASLGELNWNFGASQVNVTIRTARATSTSGLTKSVCQLQAVHARFLQQHLSFKEDVNLLQIVLPVMVSARAAHLGYVPLVNLFYLSICYMPGTFSHTHLIAWKAAGKSCLPIGSAWLGILHPAHELPWEVADDKQELAFLLTTPWAWPMADC